MSGWWFGLISIFHQLGLISPTDFHIFRGWNHQPDVIDSLEKIFQVIHWGIFSIYFDICYLSYWQLVMCYTKPQQTLEMDIFHLGYRAMHHIFYFWPIEDHIHIKNWLVVWNIFYFHILGIIIPTDELIFFQRGWNHQPEYSKENEVFLGCVETLESPCHQIPMWRRLVWPGKSMVY